MYVLGLPGILFLHIGYRTHPLSFVVVLELSAATIIYTGHSERGTGNWCFKDGTISFQEVFDLYRRHFRGRLLTIVTDCCYSGNWVYACAEALDNMGIPPCGHKAREQGVLIKVFASCLPDQKAGDLHYSLEGVELDENRLIISRNKQLTDTQTTMWGDFTKLVCCREPDNPCREGTFKNWRWQMSGKIRRSIRLVRGKDRGRPAWHYTLLSSGDEENVDRFKAQYATGTINVADWGYVLASGWGEDPPESVEDKVLSWTTVIYPS